MSSSRSRNVELARQFANRAVALASASPDDKVLIFGSEQIDLLVELATRGFVDVACSCLSACGAPSIVAERLADIVLAPDVRDEAGLCLLLSKAQRVLAPDGVVVVRIAHSCLPAWLHEDLTAQGFTLVQTEVTPYGAAVLLRRVISNLTPNLLSVKRLMA